MGREGVLKPTVKPALGCCRALLHPDPARDGHPVPHSPSCTPSVRDARAQTRPGSSVIPPRASGPERRIPDRTCWSKELSRTLIHDLILRRAITQSPVLFLAATSK